MVGNNSGKCEVLLPTVLAILLMAWQLAVLMATLASAQKKLLPSPRRGTAPSLTIIFLGISFWSIIVLKVLQEKEEEEDEEEEKEKERRKQSGKSQRWIIKKIYLTESYFSEESYLTHNLMALDFLQTFTTVGQRRGGRLLKHPASY